MGSMRRGHGEMPHRHGGPENRVFITNAIRLESVNGPLVTTIDGASESGSCCVYLSSNAVLSGFTLTNGWTWNQGGGVFSESTGVVTNCTLTGNTALTYYRNSGWGGGAYGGTSDNCTLTGNLASEGGGAFGGNLYNCTLTGNLAGDYYGGGGASRSTLYNCTLSENSRGGASGTLYNCLVTDNEGESGGLLYGCTVVGNRRSVGYGLQLHHLLQLWRQLCRGNDVEPLLHDPPAHQRRWKHHRASPFMDMAVGDFRLREESPCIDAGTT